VTILSQVSSRSTSMRGRGGRKLFEEAPSNRRCCALIVDERERKTERVKRESPSQHADGIDEDSFLSEDPRPTSSR